MFQNVSKVWQESDWTNSAAFVFLLSSQPRTSRPARNRPKTVGLHGRNRRRDLNGRLPLSPPPSKDFPQGALASGGSEGGRERCRRHPLSSALLVMYPHSRNNRMNLRRHPLQKQTQIFTCCHLCYCPGSFVWRLKLLHKLERLPSLLSSTNR